MSDVNENTKAQDVAGKSEDIITKDLIERALRSGDGRDITVTGFTITKGASFGDGYMSVVHAVNVEINDGGERKIVALVVKVMSEHSVIKEMAVDAGLFKKEIGFYKNVLPELSRFQQEQGVQPLVVSVPKFYHGYEDTSNHAGVVVMEDLRPQGYVMVDMKKGFDYDHCCLVMKELAKLHALSFAFKCGKDEVIESKFGDLMKDVYLGDFLTSGYDFGKELREVLCKSLGFYNELHDDNNMREKVTKHFERYTDDPFAAVKRYLTLDQKPYRVICHGDTWGNNMMFRYHDNDGSGQRPVGIKLLDMQVCRYALPTTDLSLFLFTCTTKSLRKEHLDDLLRLYHGTFINTLKHVNAEYPEFTFEVFHEMFINTAMFGVLCACDFLYGICGGQVVTDAISDAKSSEEFMEVMTSATDRIDAATLANMKERIAGVIHDAAELGLK